MTESETLPQSIFHKLSSVLWALAVVAIVVLASYVSLGRLLANSLADYQDEVLAQLNERVPFRVDAGRLSGEWHSFTPEIVLTDLRLKLPGAAGDTLELKGGRVGLDVLESILTRRLQITSIQLEALVLQGELTEDGRLVLPGLTGRNSAVGDWLKEFLLNIEYVTLDDAQLQLDLPGEEQRQFGFNLHLAREGSERKLQAELVSTRGAQIQITGRGVGNPFRPEAFRGQLHIAAATGDLGAVKGVLANEPPAWMDGQLDAQWWFDWNRGALGVDLQLSVADAVLRPKEGDWSVPLEHLSLSASLVERRNRWTVYASDIVARQGDAELVLPRMQVDAWDESLRLRASELDLAALNALVLGLESLPEKAHSVFEVLQPKGKLSALQLAVADLTDPTANWDVEANFEAVEVESWRAAPGVTSASGYLELSQNGGYVVLDSQRFSMSFPSIYRSPLYYDDIFGTLKLSWDKDSLLVDSDPIVASGVEGTAKALFRLNIPFKQNDVGLEMDLVVGLANSHPIHRVKYIPYVLNESLRQWLAGAVGDGDVGQAAFIWRGSLRKGATDLRTVQLFLNVANTSLDYHPQWPAVSSVDGTVLIDDSKVSVWADSARVYDSRLERLSAEAWMNEERKMLLAVEGRLSGSAQDGLAIVNESLLGELTRGAFQDWQAEGELDARLQLLLNLGDKSVPPEVDVSARLEGARVQIEPGGLTVTDLSGVVDYSSEAGFSSDDLKGKLWERALAVELKQRPLADPGTAMSFANSALEVQLETDVAMTSVQQWLDLKVMTLASGSAQVTGLVELLPGEKPTLMLDSQLQGISLDLPQPWRKEAESERPFKLKLPLGAGPLQFSLQLGEEVDLDLDVRNGALYAASAGIASEPPALTDQVVRVVGRAPRIDVDEWERFIERYLLTAAQPGEEPETTPTTGLRVQVDDVYAEQLAIWGRVVNDVRFSLAVDANAWQVRAETDWLRGSYFQPEQGRAGLKLDFLEMAGFDSALDQPELSQGSGGDDVLQLPQMQVVISQLHRESRPLGALQFGLESVGETIQVRDLTGELAGLRLTAEQPASLDWHQGRETQLSATLQFTDFGQSLQQLGYPLFLETSQGQIDLALSWPGSPQGFSLGALQGSMLVDVDQGRFLETPAGATGALKVVSVLNLAEVVQRLSMSHMFESGVPFRQMDGEVYFHGGTIEVSRFEIQGASSAFSMTGLADVESETLEGELVATLPVANNLPWVAALAGGLPVAAGVFVVSKVFEKQVNRLTSGVYKVDGPWDDPNVTFDRIFDDGAKLEFMTVDPNSVPADPNQGLVDQVKALGRVLEPPRAWSADPNEPAQAESP